jgi:hypothetical protein
MEREIFKQELVKFAKWYQMEEMQRKEKKLFTAIVDDYMQNVVLPQADVIKSVCDCKPMEYDVDGIRFFKCRICGEPMK